MNHDQAELQRRLDIAIAALADIACFQDAGAQERFNKTGSYSSFDEPNSVEIARIAIVKIELGSFGETKQ